MLSQIKVNIKGKIKIIDKVSFKGSDGKNIEYKDITLELPGEKENATLRLTPKSESYETIKESNTIEGQFLAVPVYKNKANLILLKAI